MSAEDEERFQSSKKYWMSHKQFDVGDNEIRDHNQITGKYRGSANWSCNINLILTKKVPAVFHNLRGYGSHLIMQEFSKLDASFEVLYQMGQKKTWLLQLLII